VEHTQQHRNSFIFALAPTVGADRASRLRWAEPLARYLEHSLEMSVRIVAEESYAETERALREGRIDAAFLGELAALHGMTIGLVDEHSTSGYLAPRFMLQEAGIDPDHDLIVRLLGRHQAVVEAVLRGDVAAGGVHVNATRPPSLDRGIEYARLHVIVASPPLPRGPVVVRAGLPEETRRRLTEALTRAHEADPTTAALLTVRTGQQFRFTARRPAPTLKSIAALAGVSYATVSRAISGSGTVAPATAARILAIVKELGYRPNGNALLLHGQKTPLVGLVVPADHDGLVWSLAGSLRRQLSAAGAPLLLCPVDGPLDETPYLDLVLDGSLGVLVVTAHHAHDPALAEVARTGRVSVGIGVRQGPLGMVTVTPDQAARTIMAALRLPPVLDGAATRQHTHRARSDA